MPSLPHTTSSKLLSRNTTKSLNLINSSKLTNPSSTCKKTHFHTSTRPNVLSSRHVKNTRSFATKAVVPKTEAPVPQITTRTVLDAEPVFRTPRTGLNIPNLFTHRYLPSEEALTKIANRDLAEEVLKVQDVPVSVDNQQISSVKKQDGTSRLQQVQQNVLNNDVSQYELHIKEINAELKNYRDAYLSKMQSAIKQLKAQDATTDLSALVPDHFKQTVHALKLDRKKLRSQRKSELAAIKAAKAATQNIKKRDEDEDEDEDDDDNKSSPTLTADGLVASRSNLRLSYKDNYRIPFFTFEGLRKELQMLKLMDNDYSAHRQYMVQCNMALKEKGDVILRSILKDHNIPVNDMAVPFSDEQLLAPSAHQSAVLPLTAAGVQVNFSTISKPTLQKVLRHRESAEDFVTLVDVRSRIRAFDSRLPGAVNIPLKEILKGALDEDASSFQTLYGVPKIPQRHTLVFYGDHEKDAIMAAALSFMKHDYQNVLVYRGGVMEWFGQAYEPLWHRTNQVAVRKFASVQEWLDYYGRNKRIPTQRMRTEGLLREFIQRRLPDDLKTLTALQQYAKARVNFESNHDAEAASLPLIGGTDYRDGISSKMLLSVVDEKITQLHYLRRHANYDVKRIHEYQMHYGPRSQESQL